MTGNQDEARAIEASNAPAPDFFRADFSDAEALRRQADDMDCLAEIVTTRKGALELRRSANAIRAIARHL